MTETGPHKTNGDAVALVPPALAQQRVWLPIIATVVSVVGTLTITQTYRILDQLDRNALTIADQKSAQAVCASKLEAIAERNRLADDRMTRIQTLLQDHMIEYEKTVHPK